MTPTATIKKKTGTALTEAEVILLMKETQGERTMRNFAAEIGVSAPYIADIYAGRRSPGIKVLKYFKIGKTRRVIVEYVLY